MISLTGTERGLSTWFILPAEAFRDVQDNSSGQPIRGSIYHQLVLRTSDLVPTRHSVQSSQTRAVDLSTYSGLTRVRTPMRSTKKTMAAKNSVKSFVHDLERNFISRRGKGKKRRKRGRSVQNNRNEVGRLKSVMPKLISPDTWVRNKCAWFL